MNTSRYLAATVLVSSLALPALAHATTIDYRNVGDFTGPSFSTNGLTATAGNGGSLDISHLNGLGVVGNVNPIYIDTNESVMFSFDSGGAVNVGFGTSGAFRSPNVADPRILLEAFDLGGVSLGVRALPIFDTLGFADTINVSGLFGNVPLTAFSLANTGEEAGVIMWQVRFTDAPPQAPSVPEPTTWVLCATGLVIGGWQQRRATRRFPLQ